MDYVRTEAVKTQLKFRPVEEGVLNILKRLDPNKARGVDRNCAKLLWRVAPGICRSLTYLFNASTKSRKVHEWKSANLHLCQKVETVML